MSKLINKGRAFVQIAPSMKTDFIEHGYPDDFAAQLEAKIDRLAKCIEDFKEVRGRKVAANRKWEAVLAQVLNTLARLDVVIRHAIAGNPEAQAQYNFAKALRQTASRKEESQTAPAGPVETQAPQPSPPLTIATAAA